MRYYALILATGFAFGQQSTLFTYDAEGRRTVLPSSGQKTEEKVLSEGPNGKTTERIVRKYDTAGKETGREKIIVEESAGQIKTTVYEGTVNGGYQLQERAIAQIAKTGEQVRTETVVERMNLNGSFDLAEKRVSIKTGNEKDYRQDSTVFQKNLNGQLVESGREVVQVKVEDSHQITTTARYSTAFTGKMELADQKVSRVTKAADGSQVEVVDVYTTSAPGRATNGGDNTPKLREQQVIERTVGPDKSTSETYSVRRVDLESERLGPLQKISRTECKVDCKP